MTITTPPPADTTPDGLEAVLDAAVAAGPWGDLLPADRALALRAVAGALDEAADHLVPLASIESHLPEARLRGEVARTSSQLRLFAAVLDDGAYLEAALDHRDPDWPSAARPDLRRVLVPIGPAAVFAASNFPFAFSVAGGDTASALAAGCPVVVKGHPGHPRLSVATAEVVAGALASAGAPEGAFALVLGEETGRALVRDRRIRVGSFTGSLRGGRALYDLATDRPDPIPFYGELGSLNPVAVTPAALADRAEDIVAGYVGSFTFGAGQLCTKPGLLLVPSGFDIDAVAREVASVPAVPLLNEHIADGYRAALRALGAHPAVRTIVDGGGDPPAPSLLATTAAALREDEALREECFGPASIVVTYDGEDDLLATAGAFEGQLTATIHGQEDDSVVPALLAVLGRCAGRVIWNGWPTGVSVTWAMQHGGPWPATTAPATTSVGTAAISRFLRPVAYQGVPDVLLPAAVREGNPLGLVRRVDGRLG